MKHKIAAIMALCICLAGAHTQFAKNNNCCSATTKFSTLAQKKAFRNAHELPLPIDYKPQKGELKSIPVNGQKEARIFQVGDAQSKNIVLVFHEWWGLNEYIQRESEHLFSELSNCTVIAVDLYEGQQANTREKAAELMGSVKKERAESIIKAVQNYVGKGSRIATIGWCMGGGWSMQATLLVENQAAGCIIYYGMPEENINRLKDLHNVPVLGIFAKRDQWISPAIVQKFEQNMKEAGQNLQIKMYDADHAFANPSNPGHDKQATQDAHALAVEFLKKNLK